jgi:hypothetical protein
MKESDRIKDALIRLMFLKTQDNLKDIVFINAILEKYLRIVKEVEQ